MSWYDVKLLVVDHTGLSRDALHIFIGLAAQLGVARLTRRTLASPLPWLAVLIGEAANEGYDLLREQWTDRPMWPGSLRDLLVTMAVPTMLLLLARYAPGLFVAARIGDGEGKDEDGGEGEQERP